MGEAANLEAFDLTEAGWPGLGLLLLGTPGEYLYQDGKAIVKAKGGSRCRRRQCRQKDSQGQTGVTWRLSRGPTALPAIWISSEITGEFSESGKWVEAPCTLVSKYEHPLSLVWPPSCLLSPVFHSTMSLSWASAWLRP